MNKYRGKVQYYDLQKREAHGVTVYRVVLLIKKDNGEKLVIKHHFIEKVTFDRKLMEYGLPTSEEKDFVPWR